LRYILGVVSIFVINMSDIFFNLQWHFLYWRVHYSIIKVIFRLTFCQYCTSKFKLLIAMSFFVIRLYRNKFPIISKQLEKFTCVLNYRMPGPSFGTKWECRVKYNTCPSHMWCWVSSGWWRVADMQQWRLECDIVLLRVG